MVNAACLPRAGGSHGKLYMVGIGQTLHIQDGVTHASQGRVDACPGGFGNLFKRQALIKPHLQHLALVVGQGIDDAAYVIMDLCVDHALLYTCLGELGIIEDRGVLIIGRHRFLSLDLSEMVYDYIVGYTHQPRRKFAGIHILALTDVSDDLDKRLLENIVGDVGIVDDAHYICKKFRLMTPQQLIKRFIVTIDISFYQTVVGHL